MKKLIVTFIVSLLCAGYLYCGVKTVEMEREAVRLKEVVVELQAALPPAVELEAA